MPPVPDVDDPSGVDLRAYIIVFVRHKGKAREYVQFCHCLRGLLDPQDLGGDPVPDIREQLVFQSRQLLLRSKDRILQFLQFRRNIALRVGQRLFADIILRHQILVGIGHLQIIAEDFIIFDPEILDAGPLPLFGLDLGQPGLSLGPGGAEPVHILMVTVPNHISLPDRNGRLLLDGTVDQFIQILQPVHILLDLLKQRAFQFRQQCLQMRQHPQRRLESDQVPRICRLIADASDQTFQIINGTQVFPQLFPGNQPAVQLFHRRQTLLDLLPVDQRLFDTASQHPGPHGGPGLVQHPQKRPTLLLFPQGLHQLQIPTAGTVDNHEITGHIRLQPGHVA